MGTIQTNVRWADNTAQLAANLKQGIDTIDAMRKAVDRTAQSLGGQGLFTAANRATAAILELGTVTKLTTAEQERNLAVLDKAIAKYKLMGQVAPTAMKEVAAALRSHVDAAHAAEAATDKHAGSIGKLTEALRINVPLAGGLSARFTENAAALGTLGIALGTAVVGYEVLGKVFDIAQKIGAQASAIRDLSTETGIAIEPLQILGNATKDFGVTTEEVARGVYNLSKRIAGDDASAAAAIGLLGLNIAQLRAQKPEEMFLTIVRALNQLPASMRAVVASDLFGGKLGATILKIGPDLDQMIAKVKAAGEFMSEDAVKGADDFADQIDHLNNQMMAFLADGLGPTLGKLTDLFALLRTGDVGILTKLFLLSQFPLADSLASGFGGTKPMAPIAPMASHAPSVGPMASHGSEEISQTQALANVMKSLREAMTPLSAIQRQFLEQVIQIGGAEALTTEKVKLGATTLGISAEQLRAYTALAKTHEQQLQRIKDAQALVASAQASYGATLASIAPKTAAEVQGLMQRGQWLDAMAPAYGLNIVQVKALAMELEVQAKITDLAAGSARSLTSALEGLGEVDNQTIPSLLARNIELEKQAELTSKLILLQSAMAGHVDTQFLPGDPANELGKVKAGLSDAEKAAQQFDLMVQLLDRDLGLVAGSGERTFEKIIRAIQGSIPAWIELLTRVLAVNAALATTQVLKGFAIGFSIFGAFAEKGGLVVPGGIQNFEGGGPVLSMTRPKLPGKDSELIRAFPGEMVITPSHQAMLWDLLDRRSIPASWASEGTQGQATGSGETHHHTHIHDSIITDMDGLARQIGKRLPRHVAENKDSAYSRGRAAYGLKS